MIGGLSVTEAALLAVRVAFTAVIGTLWAVVGQPSPVVAKVAVGTVLVVRFLPALIPHDPAAYVEPYPWQRVVDLLWLGFVLALVVVA